ncbi:unnamed protein product [Clonostachys rosea f. rosea IK726]|uniref:Linalool dehydratase/isomerase domain-containing protein n=2 Tax=Bionectria ochroleuca TaxID=29856 RepID=A0A0B7K8C2_BIOOC|nr:unnamed protein product [Clonostachys rosea f. rosea IK726]
MLPYLLVLATTCVTTLAATPSSWSPDVQQLFSDSMKWLDMNYDSNDGYLYDLNTQEALRHETRSSAWYALGLLARNENNDAAEAEKIIVNVIGGQFKNTTQQWYGTYQKYPEEPEVGSPLYSAKIYNSWDPNWRGFVGTTFIIILEEYYELLSADTQKLILDSLVHTAIGDSYRNGGQNGDNLYPSYSNPAIMRAFVSGWVGRKTKDQNMTSAGEAYANEIIALFNKTNTLSEFNSATYTGVSVFGLTLWSTYLPGDSAMSQMGPVMLQKTWDSLSQLWHPTMKNLAGPWDRTYGYDMNRYVSIMALWFWAYLGKNASSLISQPHLMSHSPDYAWGPLVAVLADTQAKHLPDNFFDQFKNFDKERTFTAQAYYPPYDLNTRNITTWMSEKLTIGGMSFNQTGVGGPAGTTNPVVVQWITDDEVAFLTLRPSEKALQTEVSPGKVVLSYPSGNADSKFQFIATTFKGRKTLAGIKHMQGISMTPSGNINMAYVTKFAGDNGGELSPSNTFEYWSFTWSMPAGFTGVPQLTLEFEVS